jgi:hypothetical protein
MGNSKRWELLNPKTGENDVLGVLTADLEGKAGSLRYLQHEVPLTAFAQTGPGRFQGKFDLGRFQGTLAGRILGDDSLDVDFVGTWNGKLRGRAVRSGGPSTPVPGASPPLRVNPLRSGRSFLGFLATPTNTRGEMARGTLHLWSGEAAKREAVAAIERNPPGWLMGNIDGEPTPGHAEAKVLFASAKSRAIASAKARGVTLRAGKELADEEFEAIWGRASGDLVYRATLSGMPVRSHGRPGPTTIQSRYELPGLHRGGTISGGLMIASGLYSGLSIADDNDRPLLGAGKALTATAETTGGMMYMSGALAEAPEAMALGGGLARLGGGAGTVFVNSYSFVEDAQAGRTEDAVADSIGVTSGVLLIIAPFTGPAAPILAAIGFALMASQLTFQLSKRAGLGVRGTPALIDPGQQREWWQASPEDFFNLRGLTFLPYSTRTRYAQDDFNRFPFGGGR